MNWQSKARFFAPRGCEEAHTIRRICRCLLLAALACVLRPTNILIWICLAVFQLWRTTTFGWLVPFRRPETPVWIQVSGFTYGPATSKERIILVVEAALCGYDSLSSLVKSRANRNKPPRFHQLVHNRSLILSTMDLPTTPLPIL